MSNLLGNLINLLSTSPNTNLVTGAVGNKDKSATDGLPFEQVLQQVESQVQDASVSQAGVQGQENSGEASSADATFPSVATDSSLAVLTPETQTLQPSFHLSIQAASLEDGMKQVTQLLQSLSSLSDEQGAALVSSLTGGAVTHSEALDFVQTLKPILKGFTSRDASALQSGVIQSQWLDRLQQDSQTVSTIAQVMVVMPQTATLLPNQVLTTEAVSTSSMTSAKSNNSWTSLQNTLVSCGSTETDLLGANTGLTTTVQLPSDWKVSTSTASMTTSDGSAQNLQALVDLLTQSNAGKVLLTQSVAYEFELKVSSQSVPLSNGTTFDASQSMANVVGATSKNQVADVVSVSSDIKTEPSRSTVQVVLNAIQEIQSKETPAPILSTGAAALLNSVVNPVVVSQTVPSDQKTTQDVGLGLIPAVNAKTEQTIVLRLANSDSSFQTESAANPVVTSLPLNFMPVSTTVMTEANVLQAGNTSLQQTANPIFNVSLPEANNPEAVLNEPSLASAETIENTATGFPATTLAPSPTVLNAPIVTQPAVRNAEDTPVSRNNTVAIEVPQIAAASNQAMVPSVSTSGKAFSKSETSAYVPVTQTLSTVPVAIPEAVPQTVATVETANTQNNPPSAIALSVSDQASTSYAVPQTGDDLTAPTKADQSLEKTTALKVKTDTQNTTWTVVTTANSDAQAVTQAAKQSSSTQAENIIQQIVNQVSLGSVQAHSVSHLSFQLVPENLGKITIQVSLVDQLVTAKILVTHADVREALQNNLVELKTSLYQAGLQIDQLQVQVQGGGAGLLAQYYQYQQEGSGQSARVAQDDQVKRENLAISTETALVGGSWNVVNLLV
jgi:flagellar hook-length control protein FliK